MLRLLINHKVQSTLGNHFLRCSISSDAVCLSIHKPEDTIDEFNKEMEHLFGAQFGDSHQGASPTPASTHTADSAHSVSFDTSHPTAKLTHVDDSGRASMVDVSNVG